MYRFFPLMLLWTLALAGCPGDDKDKGPGPSPWLDPLLVIGPSGGTAQPDGGAPVALTIQGQVTFDRLPVTASGLGSTPVVTTADFVLIEAVRHNSIHTVVATTATDASGNYTLNLNVDHDFFVRVRASRGNGNEVDRVFHPRTSPALVHAVSGPILQRSGGNQNLNLHASYALPDNRAGAFAILDTIGRMRAAVATSFPALGELDVFWCTGATTPTGTDESGPNARPAIYLLGGTLANPTDTDHDEYDEAVIAHEWASFLQLTKSRDNNFGGPHAGEELIYTAAYSEGVVTAVGCAILDLRVYRDTIGYPGGTPAMQFEFDLESGLLPGSGAGYANEFRVSRVVWDMLDGAAGGPTDFDSDGVAITLADFLTSFAALATRSAPYEICWLASLWQQLIDDLFTSASTANAIMAAHGEVFPPGGGADPFPAELTVGGAAQSGSLDAYAGTAPNPILGPGANGVYRVTLASPASVQFLLTNTTGSYSPASHRLELTVHDLDRNILALHGGDAANKGFTLPLGAGTYLVRVQHRPNSGATSGSTQFSVSAQ